jgi:hypothetical protein
MPVIRPPVTAGWPTARRVSATVVPNSAASEHVLRDVAVEVPVNILYDSQPVPC